MKYQEVLKVGILTITLAIFTACGSTQNQQGGQGGEGQRNGQNQRGQRPTVSQLIAEMDANKDGKLSKDEVKGPLANDFSKIDTNEDGYISEEELENAPKPERGGGQRGGGRRQ